MLRLVVGIIYVFLFKLFLDRHLVFHIVGEHPKFCEKEFSRSENIYVIPAVNAGFQDCVGLLKNCLPDYSIAFRLNLLSFWAKYSNEPFKQIAVSLVVAT